MRWLYAAFWIIVGGMLFVQFNGYNSHLNQVAEAKPPAQQHFYFVNSPQATESLAPPPKPDGADVKQVAFASEDKTPTPQNFTCHVTLKNEGNLKATDIQVLVSPFRGISLNDPDANPRGGIQVLSDSDPLAQYSQWVSFPDLDPGQSVTQDVVFLVHPGYSPGDNANPQIIFHTEKPQPPKPPPVFPPSP